MAKANCWNSNLRVLTMGHRSAPVVTQNVLVFLYKIMISLSKCLEHWPLNLYESLHEKTWFLHIGKTKVLISCLDSMIFSIAKIQAYSWVMSWERSVMHCRLRTKGSLVLDLAARCCPEQVTFNPCLARVKRRKPRMYDWLGQTVPNVLSPRDLVSRPDNTDKTVLHTIAKKKAGRLHGNRAAFSEPLFSLHKYYNPSTF